MKEKNEILKQELHKLKPKKTFLGISSAILFFIVPEIIAFIWGDDIKKYFDLKASQSVIETQSYLYTKLGELLSEGSWLNIIIGLAIIVWAFF